MVKATSPHARRFKNWCKLGGKPLMTFARLIEERFTPRFLEVGFERVEARFWDSGFTVGGNEILLERRRADAIQSVCLTFEKGHRPRVQVHLAHIVAEPRLKRIRHAAVVKLSKQYYCFWGRPWWWPPRLWSARASERVVERLAGHVAQSLAFLDEGARGPNIGRCLVEALGADGPRGGDPG